jgi:hypothetical protein
VETFQGRCAHFNSVKGAHNIPLAYVIREQETPDPNAVYQTEYQRLISIIPLTGIEYEDVNKISLDPEVATLFGRE